MTRPILCTSVSANDDEQSKQFIAKWNRAASTIGRAWRRHRDLMRRLAVSVIETVWLAHTYAPGGKGYARMAEAWNAKCRVASGQECAGAPGADQVAWLKVVHSVSD